jgi:hypothetical protein
MAVIILPFIGVAFIWKLYPDEQNEYRKEQKLRKNKN